jgi:hypothetical protein
MFPLDNSSEKAYAPRDAERASSSDNLRQNLAAGEFISLLIRSTGSFRSLDRWVCAHADVSDFSRGVLSRSCNWPCLSK